MKHIHKKFNLQGAGGWSSVFGGGSKKAEIKPAVLNPPNLGNFQTAGSNAIAESIDLLCDGPIEGLVSQDGKKLNSNNLFQGVYLDNTPVQAIDINENNGLLFNYNVDVSQNIILKRLQNFAKIFWKNSKPVRTTYDITAWTKSQVGKKLKLETKTVNRTTENFCIGYNTVDFSKNDILSLINITFGETQTPLLIKDGYQIINAVQSKPNDKLKNARFFAKKENGKNITEVHPAKGTIYCDRSGSESIMAQYLNLFINQKSNPSINKYEKVYLDRAISKINDFKDNSFADYSPLPEKQFKKYTKKQWRNLLILNGLDPNLANNTPELKDDSLVWDSASQKRFVKASAKENIDAFDKSAFIVIPGDDLFNINNLNSPDFYKNTNNTVNLLTKKVFDSNNNVTDGEVKDVVFKLLKVGYLTDSHLYNFLIPKIDSNGRWDGKFYGFIVIDIPVRTVGKKYYQEKVLNQNIKNIANNSIALRAAFKGTILEPKYNYTDILCEFKNGTYNQQPLKYFNRIYTDYDYGFQLSGPFRIVGQVERVRDSDDMFESSYSPKLLTVGKKEIFSTPDSYDNIQISSDQVLEGSKDSLRTNSSNVAKNYSDWDKSSLSYDEDAIPMTHVIENPNVDSVIVSITVDELRDTLNKDRKKVGDEFKYKAGDAYPGVLRIRLEWGIIRGDVTEQVYTRDYKIMALIQSSTTFDLGNPESKNVDEEKYKYLTSSSTVRRSGNTTNVSENGDTRFSKIVLPALSETDNNTTAKRYIRIYKSSTETNSVLIRKNASVQKITEVINANLNYPFSAVAGVKLSAKSFSSLPARSYDCRLKQIQIPTNYHPLNIDGTDKRYIKKSSTYTNKIKIYEGDWDGDFKLGWTDNPAWILYDILTSNRYGLGQYIDASQINIWELYKIGRFCDAVDDYGYFIGVSDKMGGLEPRYSCNILLKESTKVYDVINIISSLFRGFTFFSNSEIHFVDDRPRVPIAIFTNLNVKDGVFNYISNRKDQQFNTVEVSYLDRFDNFKSKIEYIEDEEDIRLRGIFKTSINTNGVTSKAMARRIGQHIIYQTIKENQSVEFFAGLEALLCRPGDLIVIEDDLKTRSNNHGKILEVNSTEGSILINGKYDFENFTDLVTLYTPTGYNTLVQTQEIALRDRYRFTDFEITGLSNNYFVTNKLNGKYYFYKYDDNVSVTENSYDDDQYAVYSGIHALGHRMYCWYNYQYSGWTFSTGEYGRNSTQYDELIMNTGSFDLR